MNNSIQLTTNSKSCMQNYKLNQHNEVGQKPLCMPLLTKTQENLRGSNVRGNNQLSYTISTRRVPLRHTFFGQRSHIPVEVKFVQPEEFCEKAGRYLDECEPACNLNNLMNFVLKENKVKLADTKMGNAFYSKNKFDFEHSFKRYLSKVEGGENQVIKRRKLDSVDAKESLSENSYCLSKRKTKMTQLKRSECTKVGAKKNNVAVINVGAENVEELGGADLKNYFAILNKPVVERNIKTHEAPKSAAPPNAEFKVVRLNYNNFTVVPVMNKEAMVDQKFSVSGVTTTKIKQAPRSTFNNVKMNYNKLNVIPTTNDHSNAVQNKYSNLKFVPVTNTKAVLDQSKANQVPKSKSATNANFKGIQVNYHPLNAVPVKKSEAASNYFQAKEVSKGNDASNVNFKVDTDNVVVNRNLPENEMPKCKSSTSINSKVIEMSSENFSVVPEANNEATSDHKMVGNKVSKCGKVQDLNFKFTEESNNSRLVMDHFTAVSEKNITKKAEVNENDPFASRFNDITNDEFDINLDFLNEMKEDFSINLDQLTNMVEHSNANTSTSWDTNQDSKRNSHLETYSALEEFNSFINF